MRLVAAAALLLGLAGSATAAPPAPREPGAYCTPAGCAGRTGSMRDQAAGFGLAVLTAACLARRRPARDA